MTAEAFESPSRRYRVDGIAGRGLVTVVYRAWEHAAERVVALKVLKPEFADIPRLRQRFLHEGLAMAALDHPHVLRIFDVRTTRDRRALLVMEHAARGSLRDLLERGAVLPLPEAVRLAREALLALSHAHARGVLHRDVQPSNLLLADDGRLRLADFGAAYLEREGRERLTATGETFQTSFAYAAPEARYDPRQATERSDVYGAGASLYHLATGRVPPDLAAIDRRPALLEALPDALLEVVLRATRPDPADRYPTASAMAEALADLQARVA